MMPHATVPIAQLRSGCMACSKLGECPSFYVMNSIGIREQVFHLMQSPLLSRFVGEMSQMLPRLCLPCPCSQTMLRHAHSDSRTYDSGGIVIPFLRRNGQPITTERILCSVQRRILDRLYPVNAFLGVYKDFAEAERAAPRV